MMRMTAPDEFLSELGDINAFITDLLECPRKSGWHWPTFYLLYVEVDRLAMLVMRVGHLFSGSILGTEESSLDDIKSDAGRLLGTIDKRQKAIIESLVQLVRHTTPITAAQRALHSRVSAHVHPKSGWYQTLMRLPSPCEISEDRGVLMRTALSIDFSVPCERIDFNTAECLQRHQRFDIGSPPARKQLAAATRAVERRLGRVLEPMGRYLLEHCKMDDLMHPSSR